MVAFLCLIYWNILYIILKMYFGLVVMSGMRVGFRYEFLSALLWPHITHHTILHLHIRYSVPGTIQCARHPTWHSRCIASILTTLCPYYPGCDVVIRATCALVSCHIWQCGVWYVCHIYMSHFSLSCMSYYSFPTNSPTYTHWASCSKLM